MERTGGWRALVADKARRTQQATSVGIVALSLQLLLLVGGSDGTPTWVQIVTFAIYALLVAVVPVMAVLDVESSGPVASGSYSSGHRLRTPVAMLDRCP